MDTLHQIQTIILLLMVVLALTTIARKLVIPYPILLVIGGLVLGLIPALPTIRLYPDLVFLVFLPPILWGRQRGGRISVDEASHGLRSN
jgi:monovalent cation/hydrogen antiporter